MSKLLDELIRESRLFGLDKDALDRVSAVAPIVIRTMGQADADAVERAYQELLKVFEPQERTGDIIMAAVASTIASVALSLSERMSGPNGIMPRREAAVTIFAAIIQATVMAMNSALKDVEAEEARGSSEVH